MIDRTKRMEETLTNDQVRKFHHAKKITDGKLVVVDGAVRGGRLTGIVVSGDYFCFPETAMDLVGRSLEGAASEAGVDVLVKLVRRSLPEGAELVGVTPEGIAEALVEAIAAMSSGWRDSGENP
jgi:lipoate---protein ligase